LRQRPGEGDQHALPPARHGDADGQPAEAVEDDVSVSPEDAPHEDVAHLVDEDRHEAGGDPDEQPDQEVAALLVRPAAPAEDRAEYPEHRVDAHRDAEQAKAEVELRRSRFEEEHAGAPSRLAASDSSFRETINLRTGH